MQDQNHNVCRNANTDPWIPEEWQDLRNRALLWLACLSQVLETLKFKAILEGELMKFKGLYWDPFTDLKRWYFSDKVKLKILFSFNYLGLTPNTYGKKWPEETSSRRIRYALRLYSLFEKEGFIGLWNKFFIPKVLKVLPKEVKNEFLRRANADLRTEKE